MKNIKIVNSVKKIKNIESYLNVTLLSEKKISKIISKAKMIVGSIEKFTIIGNEMYVNTKSIKDKDDRRTLGYQIGKELLKRKIKNVLININIKDDELIQGLQLGVKISDKYKSEKQKNTLKKVILLNKDRESLRVAWNKNVNVVESQTLTQELIDLTGEDGTSEILVNMIKKALVDSDISINVYNEDFLKEQKMNGHLAVNRASKHQATVVKLTYTPKFPNLYTKDLVFIGKGLTYDTGGLSLKPTNSMINMQADKSGAMTLVGLMKYIMRQGSKNKITCYISLAENSLGSESYRPGDVLTMKNGKTVMVKNTDAEGRLVLFDSLCLAQEQAKEENRKIDKIYSIATLTGAAVGQFGEEAAGLVGFNDKMKKELIKCGNKQGEIFLDAQFHKYMLDGVKDSIADLSNTGTPYMGCAKAGLFLTNAIDEINKNKFLHIDIAGPAYTTSGFGSYKSGASGFGVRSLIKLCS